MPPKKQSIKATTNKPKPNTEISARQAVILQQLNSHHRGWVREHRFHDKKLWRFDFANLELKLAIEIEGLCAAGQKSRHTTIKGYQNDCEKYNAAALLGWTVLRYTYRTLYQIERDIILFLAAKIKH